jgi:5,5'-dehydrodivanillate O-demethylase
VENGPDNLHTAFLHAEGGGERAGMWGREIPRVTWTESEYGIICHSQRARFARSAHVLLPTANRLPQPWPGGKFKWPRFSTIWRTPVDDANTLIFEVVFTPYVDGRAPTLPEGCAFDITEELHVHRLQDFQAIVSQDVIYDRRQERLGASDRGVILLRKLIRQGIEAVQRGEDPPGVWRTADRDRLLDFTDTVVDGLMVPATA